MKNNVKIFIALCAFYIVVAMLALLLLNGKGSPFTKDENSYGAEQAVLDQTVIGETENDYSAEAVADETPAEEVVEVTETVPEPEPEPEPETVQEIRYFTFVTNTTYTILRLREGPSENAKILAKLQLRTPGYVLKPGNDWCMVVMPGGTVGFCSTQYLKITEVTRETYPADYVDMVEAADEELTVPQFNGDLIDGTAITPEENATAEGTEQSADGSADASAPATDAAAPAAQ